MNHKEIVCATMKWIPLAQLRVQLAGSCENVNEISGFIKGRTFFTTQRLSASQERFWSIMRVID